MDVYLPIANLSVNGLVIVALGALTGILSGLFITSAPFMRTPKMENRPALIGGLMMAWQEGLLFLGALIAAAATAIAYGRWNTEANLWIFMLLIQTIPYASAVAISLIAALPARRHELAIEGAAQPAAPAQAAAPKDGVKA